MDKPPSRALIFKAIRDFELEGPKHSEIPNLCCAPRCYRTKPEYRCLDCFQPEFMCPPCMFTTHKHIPLHRIEWWNNKEFIKTGLEALGMRIQLGHRGRTCPTPAGDDGFCIIDSAGVHKVPVDFCGCPGSPSRGEQLLASRLYPQRCEPPQIAVAFQMAYALEAPGVPGSTAARYLQKI
ncbi:hypothetical protein C8F04DRAFT_1273110 [Mycena alexandri]|uniref:CxC2-like cysteine cluster KDZ transposase-associated domain-containing protein n=1 Tax=Mycena alexandri TaxID=1745969 RepID=A0AAD6S6W2_9AGAR|nr:hypothetical protein C8F04DRAFT_1273110 [Mycena alexandri]